MSAPLIVPKGDDRSMTRAMYTALNKIMRHQWWEKDMEKKMDDAILETLEHGVGYLKVERKYK